jgi:hypothetical protein
MCRMLPYSMKPCQVKAISLLPGVREEISYVSVVYINAHVSSIHLTSYHSDQTELRCVIACARGVPCSASALIGVVVAACVVSDPRTPMTGISEKLLRLP